MKIRGYKKIVFLVLIIFIISYHDKVHAQDKIPLISITLDSGETPNIDSNKLMLIPDRKDQIIINRNTDIFQNAVDYVADAGGGSIMLPQGSFYFLANKKNYGYPGSVLEIDSPQYTDCEHHVIRCRDHVKISGKISETGENLTVLYPVGSNVQPTDMFYFADLLEKDTPNYLVNADFENLTIDGTYTYRSGKYTAKGKGFYILLFKDCDWDHVTVRNTEATGFGMDCPINCTVRNCMAYGCGRGADSSNVGASGFGIGFGYSSEENILIENCVSAHNRKFGFFFENQTRFVDSLYQQLPDQLICRDCTGIDNMYNFGGEMAYNSWYYDCVNIDAYPGIENTLGIDHLHDYYFGQKSQKYHIIENGMDVTDERAFVNLLFRDIKQDAWYYPGVSYMFRHELMQGKTDKYFGIAESLTRAQMAVILWRMEGSPDIDYSEAFPDVSADTWYTEAVLWANEAGVATGYQNGNFGASNNINREQLATMLYRYAALKGQDTSSYSSLDAFKDSGRVSAYAEMPMQWCIKNGIITGKEKTTGLYLDPQASASRAECAVMMMRYLQSQ